MFALAAATQLLFFSLGNFRLESGQILEKAQIGYRAWGEMNAKKDNVILVPSWFNGKSGDLEAYVGEGNLIDPAGFYVVAVDALSNSVSTSPSNSETQKGELYPRISIRDMVESQHQLLLHLGVQRLHAVIGISMGGMQAFQWAVQYPDFVDRVAPIVGTPKMTVKDILLWTTYVNMIPGVRKKKSLADLLAGFRGAPAAQREERQFADLMADDKPAGLNQLSLPKSPNDVRRQFEAVLAHNVSKGFASLRDAAKAVRARMLIVSATQDKVVSPELPIEFGGMVNAQIVKLAGDCGHNAYKCEKDALGPVLNRFLRDSPSAR